MTSKKKALLHHYTYDPLDRHVKSGLSGGTDTQLFYCRERVATEIKGTVATQIFESEEAVLAYRVQLGDTLTTTLVAGDDKRSTLSTLNLNNRESVAYTPYGASSLAAGTHQVHGFNGERPDPLTGHYLLGNGYRAFNPVLMRFNSPDSWSPFGEGGINAYAYCLGDPVNRIDPGGNISTLMLNRAFTIISDGFERGPPRTWTFSNRLQSIPEHEAVEAFVPRIDKSHIAFHKDQRIVPLKQQQRSKLHAFIRKNRKPLVEFLKTDDLVRKKEIYAQLIAKQSKTKRNLQKKSLIATSTSSRTPARETERLASSIRQ